MLKFLTSGESHGPQLTAVLDGFPAGFRVDIDGLNYQLARRQKGYGRSERMSIEKDTVQIVSGLRNSFTLGGPITLVIPNKDWANWQKIMDPVASIGSDLNQREQQLAVETTRPRPGHADLPGAIKHDHHDMRNVLERASARETAARVAVGALARQLLEHFDISLASHVIRIGPVAIGDDYDLSDLKKLAERSEQSRVRCLDNDAEAEMIAAIDDAAKDGDSLGGVAEVIVRGLPVGLGGYSQWSDRLDGRLAGAMMAVNSVKGVEIGRGFEEAKRRGSEVQDEIFYDPYGDAKKKKFHRTTNRAGGIEGGMTNGEDVIIRVASKPLATLKRPLQTVDIKTKEPAEAMVERTDVCIVPALAVVCEAVAALVLADAFLAKFGSDSIAETTRNYQSYLKIEF
ncbi:MAG: chorismate synthase [candidate division Zixibacteria bacterium]|nr:chorismate synthase [candidate division Zixibacteria bacterium]